METTLLGDSIAAEPPAESIWEGFRRIDFTFEGRAAVLVFPKQAAPGNPWLLKTEYFGAFPATELEMLGRGYHLAYVANRTRWYVEEDADMKHHFCAALHKQYGLDPRCIPVGMSCGGMHAVYFAAKYPEDIAALYLDAPVMNLLSCPCGLGIAPGAESMYDEFTRDTGMTVSDLINYRNHPIDRVDDLIANGIPVALVCGDSDQTVPYAENGKALAARYRDSVVPFFEVVKPGCDHHPHGLEDPGELIEFLETNRL